jgi:outer membrane receptor protein involved in Fe transport
MGDRRPAPGAENTRRRHRTTLLRALAPLLAAVGVRPAAAQPPPTSGQKPPSYETVVTAPRPAEQPREDVSASASVITTDRTPRAGEDLPRLLSELPGMVITRYGSSGSLSTASVRGSGPNQVAVYADGVPLDSALTGSLDLSLIPLTGAQRIEVYRGSSPLGFGSAGMGGVLSVTSEAPARSGLSLHSGLGSFGTRAGGAEIGWVHARGSVVARAEAFDSRADFPYRSDNRTLYDPSDDRTLRRQNNQLAQLDVALRAALDLPGARGLYLSLSGLGRRQGLTARGSDDAFAATLERRRLVASAQYDSPADLGFASRLRATAYLLLGEQRLSDPLGEVGFVPADTRDRSVTTGASLLAMRPLADWLLLSALLDGRREAFFPDDRLRPDLRPPGQRIVGSAAVSGTATIGSVRVIASARAEAARDQVSPVDLFGAARAAGPVSTELLPMARLGLVQAPHPTLRLRANAGWYARLPTLFERYGNGGIIVGNPALRPERGFNADLGAAFAPERGPVNLHLDAALFAARADDLIHFQRLGYFAGYLNVAASRSVGVELSASARWTRRVRLFMQTTVMDLRDRSGISGRHGRQLPHQPRLRAYLRPELENLPVAGWWRAGVYADAEVAGPHFHDPANLVRQRGRLVLGAGAHLDYARAGLRLLLSAYNLGDTRIADVIEFPLPGRSFFLTLHFSYPAT